MAEKDKKYVYKIRNKETGLYSKGGSSNYKIWTATGKTWSSLGDVKKHLRQFITSKGFFEPYNPYENSELIEIELVDTDVIDVFDMMKDLAKS